MDSCAEAAISDGLVPRPGLARGGVPPRGELSWAPSSAPPAWPRSLFREFKQGSLFYGRRSPGCRGKGTGSRSLSGPARCQGQTLDAPSQAPMGDCASVTSAPHPPTHLSQCPAPNKRAQTNGCSVPRSSNSPCSPARPPQAPGGTRSSPRAGPRVGTGGPHRGTGLISMGARPCWKWTLSPLTLPPAAPCPWGCGEASGPGHSLASPCWWAAGASRLAFLSLDILTWKMG